jgi:hypothetical protein
LDLEITWRNEDSVTLNNRQFDLRQGQVIVVKLNTWGNQINSLTQYPVFFRKAAMSSRTMADIVEAELQAALADSPQLRKALEK